MHLKSTADDREADLGAAGLLDRVVAVCAAHGATVGEVLGRSRVPRIVVARHAAMAMIRGLRSEFTERTIYSYPEIGAMFGRDHTTVMNAVQVHRQRVADYQARHAETFD